MPSIAGANLARREGVPEGAIPAGGAYEQCVCVEFDPYTETVQVKEVEQGPPFSPTPKVRGLALQVD